MGEAEPVAIKPLSRIAFVLAAGVTLFHLLAARGYGIFRDELYYLACAQHLDWGYVDHPPLIALVAWAVRNTLGTSLFALRLVPALAAGLLVLLTAAIARHLGGGRFAQGLAGLAAALAPVYLGLTSILSMNALDLVFWSILLLLVVRLLNGGDRRLWILFGVVAGVGLENKFSVIFLGFGVAVGLVAARQWSHLRDRRLWLGAAIAVLLFVPHLVWQVAHGWPTAEFVRNATETKNIAFSPVEFLRAQALMMNPMALPLWLLGLGALFFSRTLRPYRLLAWAYIAVLLVMLSQNAKPYYLSPIYPALFAAGAVAVERFAERRGRVWLRPASLAAIGLSGAILAPLAMPFLSEDAYVAYAARLGLAPGSDERHDLGRLPQFFADMHGWQALAESVARVHAALPPAERERACIYGQNYGEAGAIDLFGPALGLPRAMSGHNSYWMWGPGACDGQAVVIIGGDREDHLQAFAEVGEAGRFDCRDCMPYESGLTLWVARRPLHAVDELWSHCKHYD